MSDAILDQHSPDQDDNEYTIANAGRSAWVPTHFLSVTRLVSALFLVFVIVWSFRIFDDAAFLLQACASEVLVLSFCLLSICSVLEMSTARSTLLPKFAGLLHQTGSSLAISSLMLLPLMDKDHRTRIHIIGSIPPTAAFLLDSGFLAALLQFRMTHVVVPCFFAIANYMIRTIYANTRSPTTDRTGRLAIVEMCVKVCGVSIAAGVIATGISSIGKAMQRCRQFHTERSTRRSEHL